MYFRWNDEYVKTKLYDPNEIRLVKTQLLDPNEIRKVRKERMTIGDYLELYGKIDYIFSPVEQYLNNYIQDLFDKRSGFLYLSQTGYRSTVFVNDTAQNLFIIGYVSFGTVVNDDSSNEGFIGYGVIKVSSTGSIIEQFIVNNINLTPNARIYDYRMVTFSAILGPNEEIQLSASWWLINAFRCYVSYSAKVFTFT